MTQSVAWGRIEPVMTSMALIAAGQFERRCAGSLRGLDAKAAQTSAQLLAVHGDAVHGDAVVGRGIPLRINILPQRSTDTLRQGQ
jgi:uncharacterized protein YcsI (UPF0317 family)